MKKVYVKKIDVLSIAKPLFFVMVLITLVIGLFISIFLLPATSTERVSVDGVIVSSVERYVPGMWSSVIGMFVGIFTSMMGVYISIIFGIVIFNVFCRYTGGIGVEIESSEE